MKKILSLILSLCMIFGCLSLTAFAAGDRGEGLIRPMSCDHDEDHDEDCDDSSSCLPFTDVTGNEWYCDCLKECYSYGIVSGLTPTTFGASVTLSRAQFVTMLYRGCGEEEVDGTVKTFPDCAAGSWYDKAVQWAVANGIVTGYNNGKFGPADLVTREQIATMLFRMDYYINGEWEEGQLDSHACDGFSDCGKVSSFAKEPMAFAVQYKIITGRVDAATGAKTLAPQGMANRAEAVTIISRYAHCYD